MIYSWQILRNIKRKPLNFSPIELEAWLQNVGNWNSTIKPDLINVVRHYQSQGVQEFALFGMCFGGQVGTYAAIELSDYLKATAVVHPRSFSNEQAPLVKIPMYLMPSRDQPDMVTYSHQKYFLILFLFEIFNYSCHSTKCFVVILVTIVATEDSKICLMVLQLPEATLAIQ